MLDRFEPELERMLWVLLLTGLSSGLILGYIFRAFYPYLHFGSLLLPATCLAWMAWRMRRFKVDVDHMKLGRDGELVVAARLDELKATGYRVFHDIPSQRDGGANIDHLAVGLGGIFVIETKTRSKPSQGNVEMFYDGITLTRDDGVDESDSIGQVRAEADELRDWLRAELEWDPSTAIRPIVTFPGWWINRSKQMKDKRVWALNDKAMVDWIAREQPRLSNDIVARICNRITERVRRHQRDAAGTT